MTSATLGHRKFIVVTLALLGGVTIACFRPAEVVGAYGTYAAACVVAYMAAHAVQDSKWAKEKS
jgi:hypothetical protein